MGAGINVHPAVGVAGAKLAEQAKGPSNEDEGPIHSETYQQPNSKCEGADKPYVVAWPAIR